MYKEITITQTADTIEEAIDKACKQLGCRRDECSFEIIDRPRKSFFGLRFTPAKVRVSIQVPEEAEPVRETPKAPKAEKKQAPEPSKATASTDKVREKPQAPKPAAQDTKQKTERQPRPKRQAEKPQPMPAPAQPAPQADLPKDINQEKVAVALQYVKDIVVGMGMDVTVELKDSDDGIFIAIYGDDNLGTIIGRRGETLDAIQYLTGLATNRLEGDYLRVTVDCGDYRLKRQQNLIEMTQRMANQVLETNVTRTLDPMTPAERRIVHATVSEIEGVSSHSVGTDPGRRVVIKTPTSTSRRPRRSRRPRQQQDRDRQQSRRPRQQSQQRDNRSEQSDQRDRRREEPSRPSEAPTPKVVKEAPLYGKVDLDLE